ncbi:MAG: tRNA (guanosine(37)-N1)-methyltransferase TrmD [Candidatus Colwellbacteria bacterium]|nr:tRNA (guanosine(37)-N1)-methyltransferase TrmD [Candidatus Colwellbacteria bacterium]
MQFDVITLFPKVLEPYLNESILGRAVRNNLITVKLHNLRNFSRDKHKKVDDRQYGGGPGMVLQIKPIITAVTKVTVSKVTNKPKVIIFSAAGKQFDDKMARRFAKEKSLVLVAGRYEGIDARVLKILKDQGYKAEEVSIGPYILTGGEIPALAVIDAVARKIPGVLGKSESLEEKRFGAGVPVYTRPEVFEYKGKKYRVPNALLSGHHKKIEEWRTKKRKLT